MIDGTAHYVIGEGDSGAPYNGFLMISNTYNLTVRDTVLTGHMTYYTMGSGGSITPMGTYDCQVTTSIGLNGRVQGVVVHARMYASSLLTLKRAMTLVSFTSL